VKRKLRHDLSEQWSVFKRILKFVKPYYHRLILGMLASIIAGVFGFSPAIMLKYLFDLVIPSGKLEYLYTFCIIIVVVYFIKGVAHYIQAYFMAWVGQRVILDMRTKVFEHVTHLSLHFFKKNKAGELIARIISDISLMEMAVSRVLGQLVLKTFSLFPPLIAVFYISWKLAILALFALPLVLYPIIIFAQKLKKVASKGQQQMGHLTSTMSESFYGIQVIKAFNMESFEKKRFMKFNRDYYSALMKAARVTAMSSPLMEMIGAIAAAIIFGIGLKMVIDEEMTQGNLMAFLTSLFLMYNPIKTLSRINYDIQRAIAGAERVYDLLDQENPIKDLSDAKVIDRVKGDILFSDVSFEYDENDPILQNVSIDIPSGETVALVGVSGVGKSTLVNLIPRFYDATSGSILIDDIDIRKITLKSLRENIGIVTQETILFNDTIVNNIAFGRDDFTTAQIESVSRAAFAHDFISELPAGYNTVIGERGVSLSGGQRQRIAIARALLKNPPILILDEATSSLDSESETLIQLALDKLIQNRTTIVVAHRLSTIRNADRIAVMDKGRIIEIGKHEDLIAKKGIYKNLYDLQFSNS
jgi:ATP-binding cassette, subfamily B, bacterial MsbA